MLKYIIGTICFSPFLPIMYLQGIFIKRKIPKLPAAKGTEGMINIDAARTLRLLILGESTMAGVGVETHEEGFAGSLAKELAQKLEANID